MRLKHEHGEGETDEHEVGVGVGGGIAVMWRTDGGNIPSNVQSELVRVTKIYSNIDAFAALRSDRTVRTWGSPSSMLGRCVMSCVACSIIAGWAGNV